MPDSPPAADIRSSVFEERAENLSRDELIMWSEDTTRDQSLLSKLKGPGAKLLSGPRGSGKSTLFKRAYYDLIDGGEVLVAYINYAHSLALEPLFHRSANALVFFRQWVLFKVIHGLAKAEEEAGVLRIVIYVSFRPERRASS